MARPLIHPPADGPLGPPRAAGGVPRDRGGRGKPGIREKTRTRRARGLARPVSRHPERRPRARRGGRPENRRARERRRAARELEATPHGGRKPAVAPDTRRPGRTRACDIPLSATVPAISRCSERIKKQTRVFSMKRSAAERDYGAPVKGESNAELCLPIAREKD